MVPFRQCGWAGARGGLPSAFHPAQLHSLKGCGPPPPRPGTLQTGVPEPPTSGPHYLRRLRPVLGRGSAPIGAVLGPSPLLQTPEERSGQPLSTPRAGSPGRALGREPGGVLAARVRPSCVFLQS